MHSRTSAEFVNSATNFAGHIVQLRDRLTHSDGWTGTVVSIYIPPFDQPAHVRMRIDADAAASPKVRDYAERVGYTMGNFDELCD